MPVSADTIEILVRSGLKGEALVAVVRSLETDIAAALQVDPAEERRRSAARARTALYRQRGGGNISAELREAVFERDDYKCIYCGSDDHLQCDHVVPVSKGGEATLDNLATACRFCNAKKKDRDRKSMEIPRNKRGEPSEEFHGNSEEALSSSLPPTPPNPSSNPKETPLRGAKKGETSEAFERFKTAYPKREGNNPWEPARQKFDRAVRDGAEPEQIIAGAQRYAAEQARLGKVGTEFVMQAKAWLNQKCWQDYPAIEQLVDVNNMIRVNQLDQQWNWCAARYLQERGKAPPTDATGGWYFPKQWLRTSDLANDEWMETDLPEGMDRRKQAQGAAA